MRQPEKDKSQTNMMSFYLGFSRLSIESRENETPLDVI